MDEHDIQQALTEQIASLSSKHVNVSYLLIAVLVLFLGVMTVGGVVAYKMFNSALAKAEQQEARYEAAVKSFQEQITAHDAERAAQDKQQQVIVKVVHDRDEQADKDIQQALSPNKSVVEAANDVEKTYGILTVPLDGSHLQFTVPQVQTFVATKIDRDRLQFNLTQTQDLFKIEQDKSKSLTADLRQCQNTLVEAQKTVDGYKAVVKSSKWKKILHGVEIGGAIVGAVLVGRGMR